MSTSAETYDYTACHAASEYVFSETEKPLPGDWVLLKKDEFVAVYRRDVKGSPIPEFRAIGEFEGIDPWTMNYCLRYYPFRRGFDTSLARFGAVWQGDPVCLCFTRSFYLIVWDPGSLDFL